LDIKKAGISVFEVVIRAKMKDDRVDYLFLAKSATLAADIA
jgi:hypothetical protein